MISIFAKPKSTLNSSILPMFIAAIAAFSVIALLLLKQHYYFFSQEKSTNIFVYLASSFLQGRLDIDSSFPNARDLSNFNGKIYAMWPPLCAFIFMPIVKYLGLYVGDYWLNAFFIGISTAAAWFLLDVLAKRQNWQLSLAYKSLTILFFVCGTSFLILSVEGAHWYMAQVAAATMMFLSLSCLFNKSEKFWKYLLSGTFWGLAVLSRMHLILAVPIFLYVSLFGLAQFADMRFIKQNWHKRLLNFVYVALPVVLVVLFIAWYNYNRFGSIFENGVTYHHMWDKFAKNFKHFGYIHPHYFLYNAYYTLLRIPLFEHQHWFKEPSNADWTEGYSLFFQSPVLLYALATLRMLRRDFFVTALWLSIIPVSLPILWLMGTGTMQFGARYLFDLFPLFFPLVIIGSGGKVTPLFLILVIASVIINMWGLHLFGLI